MRGPATCAGPRRALDESSGTSGAPAAWGGKEGLAEVKEWLRLAQELGKSLTDKGYDQPVGAQDEQAAEALQQWRVLWQYVTGVYDGLKAELRALDFDDLERLAWQLVTADRATNACRRRSTASTT